MGWSAWTNLAVWSPLLVGHRRSVTSAVIEEGHGDLTGRTPARIHLCVRILGASVREFSSNFETQFHLSESVLHRAAGHSVSTSRVP